MVLHTPCLREFVEVVPTCPETIRLTAALAALGLSTARGAPSGLPDQLVLVNAQQQAIGWVSSQQLLHQLLTANVLHHPSEVESLSGSPQWHPGDRPLREILPPLVQPLTLLSGDLPIDQFLPYLRDQPQACYGLADAEGTFLGLLSSTRLLQFLTAQLSSAVGSPPAVAAPKAPTQPTRTAELHPLLLTLLERLPLPVMLQTRDGQVLAQNAIWRNQIGALLDPGCLSQEVAALLELPTERHETALPPEQAVEAQQARSPVAPAIQTWIDITPSLEEPPSAADNVSLCHLGTEPGTCICVCPLKGGQEQVLQFVRIPIGRLSSYIESGGGDRAIPANPAANALTEPDAASPFFRLATLLDTFSEPPPGVEQRPLSAATGNLYQSSGWMQPLDPTEAIADTEDLWLVLAQDVTEQQQLARELTAKNADLVQLNRLKDEFLACISHELRTPLTAVLGLSSLLKDQTLGALNQRQTHYAQLIYQSGRQLMAVVNDILDLTRMETGQLELVLEPVNISMVCQRAFEQAQQIRIQESNQEAATPAIAQPSFVLDLEPDLGFLIADEQRLRQMLSHLLSNALKFTELDGAIGLKVGHWGGWIAFTVWDTGIGIPAEKQHLIFQKFQQLENPLTRRFEGTGLGLVLTQRLARLHGGDVTFISKVGQGSQFTILLPPNPPTAHPLLHANAPNESITRSAAVAVPASALNQQRTEATDPPYNQLVLIVEAVPQFIEVLSEQLGCLGYQVAIARSGTEALEKARRLQPCVLFLNPVLPLLSGWDVLTLLKSNLETRQIPVVVMATKVDEEQARQRQAAHLLSLPIQPKALQKCLHQLVTKPQATKLKQRSATVLTVLRLSPGIWSDHHQPLPTADLNVLLHSRQYRVLEADDLEQAELLVRVWKPNVVLFDGILVDRSAYFEQYSRHIFLAALPLVTIDPITTEAANQVPGLLVFPCLSTPNAQLPVSANTETSALLQVIQVAAGYTWQPSILVLDVNRLPLTTDTTAPEHTAETILGRSPKEPEWIQALMQYLNTARLRGLVGRCWQEVLQQVESHSIDVLIFTWTDVPPPPFTLPMLQALQQLKPRSPILVLDHRSWDTQANSQPPPLPPVLQQMATQILPASLPMADLLHQIHQAIRDPKK